jgi:transposase
VAESNPQRGKPAEAPWCLALITVMQFAEDLTDRAAANAVRSRIDWKYALSLDLTDPGFHYSVLAKLRKRLVSGQAEQVLLDALLKRLQEQGFLKAGGHARTNATHVLAAIRACNRLECVGETLRAFGLRQCRYRGLPKTHLQHLAIAAAINIDRLAAWLDGRPHAQTRTSRFAALAV